MHEQFRMIAKTFHGLEPILATELRRLGATYVTEIRRGVRFTGDLRTLYKANLHARTALRILVDLHEFPARNEHQLYNRVQEIDWSQYLDVLDTFAIDAVTNSHIFRHSKFAALKTKDAIADQFRQKTRRRPSVHKTHPDIRIHLHVTGNRCSLSLDSSGESLHRRGYRQGQATAPLSEVLAAGMLLIAGWNGEGTLLDPMCGSGTLLTEAGMIAANIAPGRFRPTFGFQKWKNYDADLWENVRQAAIEMERTPTGQIYGSDKSPMAVRLAERNLEAIGLLSSVQMEKAEFSKKMAPEGSGLIVTNPPYGERLKEEDLVGLYRRMGDTLKQHYTGWKAWILSGSKEGMKAVGLRASIKKTLYNGPLECRYYNYDLYAGTAEAPAPVDRSPAEIEDEAVGKGEDALG
ncbi:MAG: THUMP domain-containing protein [Bacteroidota bacterium]